MTKRQRLLQEAAAAAKFARDIAEKASSENRDMTDDEHTDFQSKANQAVDLKTQADAAKADEELLAKAAEIGALIGPEAESAVHAQANEPTRLPGKNLGQHIVKSGAYQNLMKQFGGRQIPEKARIQSDAMPMDSLIGRKSLFVGGSGTSAGAFVVHDRTNIVEMTGRRQLSIRDLITVLRTNSDAVEYVQQTSHTNNAAPVAEATSAAAPTTGAASGAALTLDPNGGYKPEGAWAFVAQTANVRTIAEWVPVTKRALADVSQLEDLINSELVADLAEAEETQIISGSGTGQNLPGILNTSGIQTQAKGADDIFVAVRKAKTKARTVGRVAPNAVLMNPTQVEAVDIARDTQSRFYGNGPFITGPSTLWSLPIIESEAVPAGTAIVGDFTKAVLWDREESTVTMTDSHADFFTRNLVAILAEERVAFAVVRPSAFVQVTGL